MSKAYDGTIARMAGNIAAGLCASCGDLNYEHNRTSLVEISVLLARMLVAEVKHTENRYETE